MKKRAMWRIAALALALVLAAGLAAPAMAYPGYTVPTQYRGTLPGYVPLTVNYDPLASVGGLSGNMGSGNSKSPPYQITIKPGNYTETPTETTEVDHSTQADADIYNRFWAYQIFAGSLSADASYPGNNNAPGTATDWEGAPGVLSDIRWGSSINDINAVLNALTSKTTGSTALTKASDVGITSAKILALGERYYGVYGGSTIVTTANTAPTGSGTTNDETSEGGYWTWNASANDGSGAWEKSSNFNTLLETALSTALDSAYTNLTLADLFNAALNYAGYTESGGSWTNGTGATSDLSDTAKVVSQVLSDFTPTDQNNTALAEAFSKILYSSNGLGEPEAKSKWDGASWTIGSKEGSGDEGAYQAGTDHLAGGYYLIVDKYASDNGYEDDTTLSDFMVGVFGDIEIEAKSEAPTVDKEIATPPANGDERDGDDFEIGEEITFKVTGTLPTNYENFDWYYYEFTDVMGKGLTYVDDSVQVYATVRIKNPLYDANGTNAWEQDEYVTVTVNINELKFSATTIPTNEISETEFYVQVTENAGDSSDETELKVHFENLKNLDFSKVTLDDVVKADLFEQFKSKYGGYAGANPFASSTHTSLDITLTAGSTFTITYKAYINDDAEFDLNGNQNRVKLTYSSDVKDKSKTTDTTEVYVYAYTFGLDLLKYDGSKTVDDVLKDAGFSLEKTTNTTEYALYDSTGNVAMWISDSELKNYFPENYTFPTDWFELSETNIPLGELAAAAYNKQTTLPDPEITNVSGNFSGYYLFPGGNSAELDADSKLTTRTAGGTYYAIVTGSAGNYTLAGWIDDSSLAGILHTGTTDIADVTEDEWKAGQSLTYDQLKNYLYPGFTSGTFSVILMTGTDGHLYIDGLDSDSTYTLKEQIVPDGFDRLDGDITVKFTAEYYSEAEATAAGKKAGQLKNLSVTVTYDGDDNALGLGGTGTATYQIVNNGKYVKPDGTDLDVGTTGDLRLHLTAANYPEGYLPGTGGRGVYAFYIGGGLLLAGAAILLIAINRKKPQGKRTK